MILSAKMCLAFYVRYIQGLLQVVHHKVTSMRHACIFLHTGMSGVL